MESRFRFEIPSEIRLGSVAGSGSKTLFLNISLTPGVKFDSGGELGPKGELGPRGELFP
jgi:hypothetical protein